MKIFDDLIEKYAPEHTEFVITVAGMECRFGVILNASELADLKRGAAQFTKLITDYLDPKRESKTSIHPSWVPYLTADPETLLYVYLMAAKCLEADTGELDFLKLQAKVPLLFEQFKDQFVAGQLKAQVGNDLGEIEASKNDSSEIPSEK